VTFAFPLSVFEFTYCCLTVVVAKPREEAALANEIAEAEDVDSQEEDQGRLTFDDTSEFVRLPSRPNWSNRWWRRLLQRNLLPAKAW
jgi:hypothetical protein